MTPVRFLRLLAVVAGLALAGPAFAHAVLVSASPPEGAVLAQAPRAVELRFNEPVEALVLRLLDARGKIHELAPKSRGERIEAALPGGLPEGTQLLSYRVVSLDGHPIGATLAFSIGIASGGAAPTAQSPSLAMALWAVRALGLTLLLGGAGMACFFAFLSPVRPSPRFRRAGLAAFGAGGALVVLSVGLQGLDLLGLPLAGLAGPAPWRAALGTSFAITALFELAAFALAALTLRGEAPGAALGLASLICIGCASAASGHAATADPFWLMRPAMFLHAAAAAIWAGSLPPLLWLAMSEGDAFKSALRRFSSIAVATVAALLVLGCIIAGVQMRDPAALLETEYGRLLSLKLGLVGALLLFALWNRRIGAPLVLGNAYGAARRISGSIAAEVLLMIGVFAVVAGWRFTPPPRALLQATPIGQIDAWSGHTHILARIEPGRVGENRLSVELLDHDEVAIPAVEVSVTLSAPWLGLEPRVLTARRASDGVWRIPSAYLPAPGAWTVAVEAMVSDFDRARATGAFDIQP